MTAKHQRHYAPEEVNELGEYTKIGGSPVPGITLQKVMLGGSNSSITRIVWSPDGKYLAVPSVGNTIRILDLALGECTQILTGKDGTIYSVAWSPDAKFLASASYRQIIRIWDVKTGSSFSTPKSHDKPVKSISWSPNGLWLASGSDDGTVMIWDTTTWNNRLVVKQQDSISSLTWSADSLNLFSSSLDKTIRIIEINSSITNTLKGHGANVRNIIWIPHKNLLASSSGDASIRLWDIQKLKTVQILEGHTKSVVSLSISADNNLLASKSMDDTIRFWDTDTWDNVAILHESALDFLYTGIAFHPSLPIIATLGKQNTIIRIWSIDFKLLFSNKLPRQSVRYTTAKLVLVGDSGVGKTGLGWRLTHGEFKEHASTHGQQFWVIKELGKKRKDGTECEAVLWDLAGQHVYRSIHSIFLDNVDAALVLFDPSNRQDPLKGAQFWLEQLKGKSRLPPSVLVGARVDRGAPVLSRQELEQFSQKYDISGGYISTSAKSGEGLEQLLDILKAQILWEQMTATVTTLTFKGIKEYVLKLKEKVDRRNVLVRPVELREQLEMTDPKWLFTDAEMMTAVGHLQNHGYVTILHSSTGEEHILLTPDLLVSLASSIVLQADKNPRELGAISESELLHGKYRFEELIGLEIREQQILLDAAVLRFLEHHICFRETLGNDTLLIFPNLIKQKRPLGDEFEAVDDVSYIVRGRVENLYASLVVLLGYTSAFTRIHQWQNQAQYEMGTGEICGFRLIEDREGELELVIYYSATMPHYGSSLFQGLFESFLYNRDVEVTRFPQVNCPNGHLQERATIIKRIQEGKKFIYCEECGDQTLLPEIEKPEILGIRETKGVQRAEALARLRSLYETNLTRVKSFRRDRVAPRCFISHDNSRPEWVATLIRDLRDAGIVVVEEKEKIQTNDFILQICTSSYKKAWGERTGGVSEDARQIRARIKLDRPLVIPLVLESEVARIIPQELNSLKFADFRYDTRYSVGLFDLVMSLYAISLNHEAFKPLREMLRIQWEQTLSRNIDARPELFISYAWGREYEEREAIVNELDKVFQERAVTIIRDKRDLGFKGRIKEFMDTIGQGKAVILVISEKYLKSPNCCFELVQIAKHGNFADHVFPIVLEDAKIYDPMDRGRYVKYWEGKKNELETFMREVSAANMDGFREDIDLYTEIRALLPRLMDVLKDMNTLTADLHRQSNFSEIFDAVMAKLEE
jgi:small GTP-binding protein